MLSDVTSNVCLSMSEYIGIKKKKKDSIEFHVMCELKVLEPVLSVPTCPWISLAVDLKTLVIVQPAPACRCAGTKHHNTTLCCHRCARSSSGQSLVLF